MCDVTTSSLYLLVYGLRLLMVIVRRGSRLGPGGPGPPSFHPGPPVLVPMKARKKCDGSADNSFEDAFVIWQDAELCLRIDALQLPCTKLAQLPRLDI